MELRKYHRPVIIAAFAGAILSKVFGFDLLFYLLIIIGWGLALGNLDNKEGKSGFFYVGLLGLICFLAFSMFIILIYVYEFILK